LEEWVIGPQIHIQRQYQSLNVPGFKGLADSMRRAEPQEVKRIEQFGNAKNG
jgi:hypothetical protein